MVVPVQTYSFPRTRLSQNVGKCWKHETQNSEGLVGGRDIRSFGTFWLQRGEFSWKVGKRRGWTTITIVGGCVVYVPNRSVNLNCRTNDHTADWESCRSRREEQYSHHQILTTQFPLTTTKTHPSSAVALREQQSPLKACVAIISTQPKSTLLLSGNPTFLTSCPATEVMRRVARKYWKVLNIFEICGFGVVLSFELFQIEICEWQWFWWNVHTCKRYARRSEERLLFYLERSRPAIIAATTNWTVEVIRDRAPTVGKGHSAPLLRCTKRKQHVP